MVASDSASPAIKHIPTSNIFELVSDDCKNITETNHVLQTEVIDVDTYFDKKIIKTSYASTSILNENRKRAPKCKRKNSLKMAKLWQLLWLTHG